MSARSSLVREEFDESQGYCPKLFDNKIAAGDYTCGICFNIVRNPANLECIHLMCELVLSASRLVDRAVSLAHKIRPSRFYFDSFELMTLTLWLAIADGTWRARFQNSFDLVTIVYAPLTHSHCKPLAECCQLLLSVGGSTAWSVYPAQGGTTLSYVGDITEKGHAKCIGFLLQCTLPTHIMISRSSTTASCRA